MHFSEQTVLDIRDSLFQNCALRRHVSKCKNGIYKCTQNVSILNRYMGT